MTEKRGMGRGLAALGLTEYEAKVYMALLCDSPATGYQVSKRAAVPRSMVYEALGRLESRGMVLKTGHPRGTVYRPLPPDLLITRFQDEQQSILAELRLTMDALYRAPVEDRLWLISERTSYLAYATHMVEEAASELLLVLNDSDAEWLRNAIERAAQRGVSVSAVLTGQAELEAIRTVRHPPPESDAQELTHTLVVIVDRREALVASSQEPVAATVTNNHNWVSIARQFVWMELFAQKVYNRIGPELLDRLDLEDRRMLEGFSAPTSSSGR
jgi:HTH-type transcriptional regulator, sugar sensing transcriptional regulator